MQEIVMRNAELGIQMTRIQWQGVDVVYAEDMRKALKWNDVYHMIRGLKPDKEYIKVSVSVLKSEGLELAPNLELTSPKGGHPIKYAYFVTRQGVSRLIATRRPHDIKDDPELAEWLDKLQDWIFGEVLPEVFSTGSYTGSLMEQIKQDPEEVVYMLAQGVIDERNRRLLAEAERDEAIRTKGAISTRREATALAKASAMTRKYRALDKRYNALYNVMADFAKAINSRRIRSLRQKPEEGTEPLF